jgi:hypothetical protein
MIAQWSLLLCPNRTVRPLKLEVAHLKTLKFADSCVESEECIHNYMWICVFYGLFCDAVSSSALWFGEDVEGNGCLILGPLSAFAWREQGKLRKASDSRLQAEIWSWISLLRRRSSVHSTATFGCGIVRDALFLGNTQYQHDGIRLTMRTVSMGQFSAESTLSYVFTWPTFCYVNLCKISWSTVHLSGVRKR